MHNDLQVFLMNNVPQVKKKKKKSGYVLGVADAKLGSAIQETLEIPCTSGEGNTTLSLHRSFILLMSNVYINFVRKRLPANKIKDQKRV